MILRSFFWAFKASRELPGTVKNEMAGTAWMSAVLTVLGQEGKQVERGKGWKKGVSALSVMQPSDEVENQRHHSASGSVWSLIFVRHRAERCMCALEQSMHGLRGTESQSMHGQDGKKGFKSECC